MQFGWHGTSSVIEDKNLTEGSTAVPPLGAPAVTAA
jgi:hypothetical protein